MQAWYTNDRTFLSVETAWADLPEGGVLAVEVPRPQPYRWIRWGGDYYWLDENGVLQMIRTHPEWGQWADPPEGVQPDMLKRAGALTDSEWERFSTRISERS